MAKDNTTKLFVIFGLLFLGAGFVSGIIYLKTNTTQKYGSDTWCMSQYDTMVINGHRMPITSLETNTTVQDCCCISGNEFICICPNKSTNIAEMFIKGD